MTNRGEGFFIFAVLAILAVVFIPVPGPAIDALLVGSFVLSLLTLLTVMSLREPSEFTIFPSLLLLGTAYRLALNIATTRAILTDAPVEGAAAAGELVRAFGSFVTAGEPAVGFIIFLLLTVVNFVVITKGAGRVSEVSARFTLDALPGKQMSVDAEFAAGTIDEAEAKLRRERISRESSFYGAMDGAMKFVRGDAVAGLLITLVNIAGGLAIGMARHGMPVGDALQTFTLLTIGDGLVSQVPALLVSIAAGLLVTRATSTTGAGMGAQLWGQIATRRVMRTAASFLAAVAVAAASQSVWLGLELCVAAAILWVVAPKMESSASQKTEGGSGEPVAGFESLLRVEPLELGVGGRFVAALAPEGAIARGIEAIRRDLAAELGILLPSVRARDEIGRLRPREYAVRVRGVKVGGGTAEAPEAVLSGVRDLLVRHAPEVVGPEDVRRLVEALRAANPGLVERCVGKDKEISLGALHAVIQNLLAENVPVRDLAAIVESAAAAGARDPETLTQAARRALSRAICERLRSADGAVRAVDVPAEVETRLQAGERVDASALRELPVKVLVASPDARARVRRWVESFEPEVAVISRDEVPRGIRLEIVGTLLPKSGGGLD